MANVCDYMICVSSVCYLMGCTLQGRKKSFNQLQLSLRFVLTFRCCVNFMWVFIELFVIQTHLYYPLRKNLQTYIKLHKVKQRSWVKFSLENNGHGRLHSRCVNSRETFNQLWRIVIQFQPVISIKNLFSLTHTSTKRHVKLSSPLDFFYNFIQKK